MKKTELRKRITKSTVACTLAAGLLFGSMNLPTGTDTSICLGTQSVLADTTNEDIMRSINVLQKALKATNKVEETNVLGTIGTVFSPITMGACVYNGACTFLKLTGVMKDPTAEALGNIQSSLEGITNSIQSLNVQMSEIAKSIVEFRTEMKEGLNNIDLNTMQDRITTFNNNQLRPLNYDMNVYNDYINTGFKNWFASEKDTIHVCFTQNNEGKLEQVFSYDTADSTPSVSVEGFKISSDDTISISGSFVNEAMKNTVFSTDNYRETIISKLADVIYTHANDGTLKAGKNFYASWKNMNTAQKKDSAAKTAEYAYNALASSISHLQMETNTQFVTKVYNDFTNYCSNIAMKNSVIDAHLKTLFLSHGFEYEVRSQVEDLIYDFEIISGVYATMALTVMQQNSLQSSERLNDMIKNWNTVSDYLENELTNSLTGYDNYCYITNSLISFATRKVESYNWIYSAFDDSGLWDTCAYKECYSETWDLLNDGDVIMNSVQTKLLYNVFTKNNTEGKSFYQYLGEAKTGAKTDSNKKLVTNYKGWDYFDPASAKITMNFGRGIAKGGRDYWDDEFSATVNSGNDGDVENKYFSDCKKCVASTFNPDNGSYTEDEIIQAIATYAEAHSAWKKDEMYLMGKADTCNKKESTQNVGCREYRNTTCRYGTTCAVLLSKPVPAKTSPDYANALEAFDKCQVLYDYSEMIPAVSNIETTSHVNPNPEKEIPVDETELPVEETDVPAEETDVPVEEADVPVEETNVPVEETDVPVEEADAPLEEADVPATDTETPTAPTEAEAEEGIDEKSPVNQDSDDVISIEESTTAAAEN